MAEEAYLPNAERGNLARMGWDLGPTIATWMRREMPELHAAFAAQDDGHNAIAQAYHHTILPLASSRDRLTEIRWGLRDFALRFGRPATGIWLPETAVDGFTARLCAAEGVRWTILAPWQSERPAEPGVLHRDGTDGASLGVVLFDADLSASISFNPFETTDADRFARERVLPRLEAAGGPADRPSPRGSARAGGSTGRRTDAGGRAGAAGSGGADGSSSRAGRSSSSGCGPSVGDSKAGGSAPGSDPASDRVVLIATDGELYGHHQKFRDLFLARLLGADEGFVRTTAGAAFDSLGLEGLPPISIRDQTSWSCNHGVARWAGDCPCVPDGRWKQPLRQAFDRLASAIDVLTEMRLRPLGLDAWALRDRYVDVVSEFAEPEAWAEIELRRAGGTDRASRTRGAAGAERRAEVLTVMRAQASRLSMFASDGWFWDDPRRIETAQVLRFAAHAARLTDGLCGSTLERQLVEDLRPMRAPGRGPDGARLYADALRVVGQEPPAGVTG